jgi:hypothetical protein
MFRHMAIVRLDPLDCEKKYFLQCLVNFTMIGGGGGGGRERVLQRVGGLAWGGCGE